jgi:hypothetical protein
MITEDIEDRTWMNMVYKLTISTFPETAVGFLDTSGSKVVA